MTIAGMTARDSISLELDKNGRVVIPKAGDFADVQSMLTYDLDSQSPLDAVACIRYTYNERPVGFVYLCSAGMGSASLPAAPVHEEGMGGPVPEGTVAPHSQDGAGSPSPADHPASRDQTPAAPTRQDITTKEGTASSIRIPANTLAILGIVFSLCIIIAIVAAVKIHVKRKEEADLLLRRQRRLERLEDIGYSSSEFDRLLAERRVSSPSARRTRRSRRKKSIFR